MKKKVLITGCAGFIGSKLAEKLLEIKKFKIYGIDNLNDYYDKKLKKKRLSNLDYKSNFKFYKLDLNNKKLLSKNFKRNKYDYVINLAAQAGVRYSITNPRKYFDSNLSGYFNILEECRLNKVKFLFFASSSSVYGDQKKMPLKETMNTDTPKSFYAATKKSNEIMSYSYSKIYKMNIVGLRFFTVYGPYGRPDMTPFSFVKNFYKKLPIKIFSFGKHKRDFTYIDDAVITVVDLFTTLIGKKHKSFYEVYNIAKGKSEKLSDYIKYLEYELKSKFKKIYIKEQLGDVKNTFADTNKIRKIIKYKSKVNLKSGVSKFVSWYKKYYNN
ncbi:NAD-dependent epimerase/dehydratase family protein [Pelagibacterales bacterium SAG-MED47]|nr:NAD-dependent epimerase/dehydratase family protein [Pelagibacterales bacterium SAG-MED47]